ncbi:transmembrane protein, putative [Medicago truncatula]|uniref:Transmembrane protein, putative n=1 Tax=Medicago truncatula TaxID=3880 RepID=G7IDM4_MEDTR|nr:transmembrane protein, putative [Medicago truncatula]
MFVARIEDANSSSMGREVIEALSSLWIRSKDSNGYIRYSNRMWALMNGPYIVMIVCQTFGSWFKILYHCVKRTRQNGATSFNFSRFMN